MTGVTHLRTRPASFENLATGSDTAFAIKSWFIKVGITKRIDTLPLT